MKLHPFFKSIKWTLLEKKLITPPVILTMEDDLEQQRVKHLEEDEEAKFLNFVTSDDDEEEKEPSFGGPASPKNLFSDEDYAQGNKNLNRLKKFTFINE